MFYEFKISHNTIEAAKTFVVQKVKCGGIQYSNQMVQEILLGLQEL